MSGQKTDPLLLSVFDPRGFQEAQKEALDQTRGLRVLLRESLSETEVVQYLFGPLPVPLDQPRVVFQVVWFGSEGDDWPLDEHTPRPMLQTETPGLGRMVLWASDSFEAGAELLGELWDLTPEPPEMQ